MSDNYYADSAFNSQKEYNLPRVPKNGRTVKQFLTSGGNNLGYFRPTQEISTWVDPGNTPSGSGKRQDPSLILHWNHEELRVSQGGALTRLYFLLAGISMAGIGAVILIYFPLCFFLDYILSENEGWGDFLRSVIPVIKYGVVPMAIIWLPAELMVRIGRFPAWMAEQRDLFRLNRRTGMVTLYNNAGKVRFSHPLVEFDCLLSQAPDVKGNMYYNLILVHRYNNSMHGVPLTNVTVDSLLYSEYFLVWNMVLCYMDTSQPLPDCLSLEEYRHLDPVTAAYDKKIGRNPRVWRDMSDKEYKDIMNAIGIAQGDCVKTGPSIDIFASA